MLDCAFDAAAQLRFYPPWGEFGLAPIGLATLRRRLEDLVSYAVS
jgi:hypothetical protein